MTGDRAGGVCTETVEQTRVLAGMLALCGGGNIEKEGFRESMISLRELGSSKAMFYYLARCWKSISLSEQNY